MTLVLSKPQQMSKQCLKLLPDLKSGEDDGTGTYSDNWASVCSSEGKGSLRSTLYLPDSLKWCNKYFRYHLMGCPKTYKKRKKENNISVEKLKFGEI